MLLDHVTACFALLICAKKAPRNCLYLWNPATGQLKDIHNYKINIKSDNCDVSLGFGFDHDSSDYKVVRIVRDLRMFSLNKNVWKEIDVELKFLVREDSFCVCVKGALYWLTGDDYAPGLVSFNVQSQKFSSVPLPDGFVWHPRIFNLKASLAIAKFHSPKTSIFTLDDDKGTWNTICTLDGEAKFRDIIGGLNTGKFVGKTVFGKVFLCDPLKDKDEVKPIHQLSNCNVRIHNYSPSLAIM